MERYHLWHVEPLVEKSWYIPRMKWSKGTITDSLMQFGFLI